MNRQAFGRWVIAGLGFVLAGTAHSGPVPPPASAYIRSLAVHPDRPGVLFAASPGGGLYRSRDAAGTWQRIDPLPAVSAYEVVVLPPGSRDRVLAGGEATGVWLSDDLGTTWRPAGPAGVTVLDLAPDPARPGRVWLLAPEGVWRTDSIDEGAWQQVWDYPAWLAKHRQPDWPDESWSLSPFQKITVDPHRPSTVLVGARWEGGYHRTDDGGTTWRHESLSGLFRRADQLLVHPARPEVWVAATHHQGLFKSYNRGRSWVATGRNLLPQRRTPHYGAYLLGGLAVSPHDPETLYAGSDYSSWKSTDGGDTWVELGRTLTCEFARTFALCPHDPKTVYAGTIVGVFKSTDGGVTWVSASRGMPERTVRRTLEVTWAGEDWCYAVVEGQPAVYRRSLTHGTDWHPMSWDLNREVTDIRFDPVSSELVLTTADGDVRSCDGGFRWDVPTVAYARREGFNPEPAAAPPTSEDAPNVIITGAVPPDDSLVDPLYRRPPFISMQLVTPGYPQDGSVPWWSTQWDRSLQGRINPPRAVLAAAGACELYVEVRDFQDGTRTGRTRFQADKVMRVEVKPIHAPEVTR